jgi:uncharacterized integral membrane protein
MTDEHQNEESVKASGGPPEVFERPGVPWGLAAFLTGVILLVLFVVQNVQDVSLEFLGWEGEYPLALIIIVVVAVSVSLDEVLGSLIRRRRRKRRAERDELRRLRKDR